MELVIGGAYQGKLDYVKSKHHLEDKDIYVCRENDIELGSKCIYHLEKYTLWCIRNQKNPVEFFKASKELWENSIIVCNDISCGVVPMDTDIRAWREQTGRLLNYLSAQAHAVTRMFCGIPQVIK